MRQKADLGGVGWRRASGLLTTGALLLVANGAEAQTLVACVGDSITQNSGWCEDLGTLLGAEYTTSNFGVSGTTLLKMGDSPYWTSGQFTPSHDFNPNIVVIMLGTNDSKPQNWAFKDQFVADYEALIDSYRALPSVTGVYLNLPPPAGTNGFNISGTVIENEVLPLVQQVALSKQTGLIDVFSAFGGHNFDPALFGSAGDQVHPNGAGAQVIADTVYAALIAPPMPDAGATAGAGGQGGAPAQGGSGGSAAGAAGVTGAGGGTGGVGGGPSAGGAVAMSGAGNGVAGAASGGTASGGVASTGGAAGTLAAQGGAAGVAASPTNTKNGGNCSCNLQATQPSWASWFAAAMFGVAFMVRRGDRETRPPR